MKNSLLYFIFISIAINLNAQFEYDCIGRKDFYILKTGSDKKSSSQLKAYEIKNSLAATQLFGANFKSKKYVDNMSDENFTQIVYEDGLSLDIPDDQRRAIFFRITSDKYMMLLSNGKTIKIGMKSDDLKAIFPKSYAKREVISNWAEMEGKTSFIVYFSFTKDNKSYLEDAWILFILSKENGLLEQIRTVEPE